MNSGSISIDRQSETHAPHWMQAIDCVTSIIASGGTMYSRSGGRPSGSSHGVTRRIFFQWTSSMSTIRSLTTGMLPIGSTVMTPSVAFSNALSRWVWQARFVLPLIRTPQEPQMAARHEQRMPIDPSSRSLACRMPSSTERCPSRSTSKSSQWAASPDSGEYRRMRSVYSGIRRQTLVGPLLRLPLRDRHGRVADSGGVRAVQREVDVLEPLVVVALGEVEPELGPAGLLALQRAHHDALGHVEHVPQLDRPENVLVEHRPAVVDGRGLRLLLEPADDRVRLGEPLLGAEHRDLLVHHLAELLADLGDPAPAGAPHQPGDLAPGVLQHGPRARRHLHLRGAVGGVLAGAAAEDQRVQQRVGAEPVAAVHRHAGHLAGRVEAGDRRLAVDVGLDAAHDVGQPGRMWIGSRVMSTP